MNRLVSVALGFIAAVSLTFHESAQAGPFADDLAKCLVSSTTPDDRSTLVAWMFSAASLHPAVKPMASVSEDQLDAANIAIAKLITKLLTDTCLQETQDAVSYEGANTLQTAFSVLGEVAGTELFNSAEVSVALAGMAEHLDEQALQEALGLE